MQPTWLYALLWPKGQRRGTAQVLAFPSTATRRVWVAAGPPVRSHAGYREAVLCTHTAVHAAMAADTITYHDAYGRQLLTMPRPTGQVRDSIGVRVASSPEQDLPSLETDKEGTEHSRQRPVGRP